MRGWWVGRSGERPCFLFFLPSLFIVGSVGPLGDADLPTSLLERSWTKPDFSSGISQREVRQVVQGPSSDDNRLGEAAASRGAVAFHAVQAFRIRGPGSTRVEGRHIVEARAGNDQE